MSNPLYGRITFGGKLKEELIPELLEAMEECIWNNHTEEEMAKEVEACKKEPQVLEYSEWEANEGQFEALEDFCVANGLTFAAFRGGESESLPEVRSYNGETKDEYHTMCDTDENAVMNKYDVMETLNLIQEFTDNPESIPLNINSKRWRKKEVAKHLAAADHKEPLKLLKEILALNHREPIKVPELEIIKY